jgi:hypothetical protein
MNGLLINPGSQMPDEKEGQGWTNTHKQAKLNAFNWFYLPMLEEGIIDVKVTDCNEETEGRWKFIFKHEITGKEVELEIHGIDNMEEYMKTYIFGARVYWNGSSSGNPELEDFAVDGFEPVKTFKKKA